MARALVAVVLLAAVVSVVAIIVWGWQRSSLHKTKAALTGGEHYRGLTEEYRRLADMAVTAQEHTDLKLGDLAVQMAQLRGQLESVQRILKDVG